MKVKDIEEKISINNEKNILCTRENGSKWKCFEEQIVLTFYLIPSE